MTNQIFTQETQSNKNELKAIESYARLLDTKFKIPSTNIRFGLDFLIGLIPFGGHIITFIFSAILVSTMAKHKVSSYVVSRMVLNIVLDTVIGSIPILGNIFDLFYKANDRNYKLLKRHYGEGKYQGSFWKVLVPVLIVLLIICILIIWALFALIGEFFDLIF